LGNNFFFHFDMLGKKKRKSANSIKGRAMGGLKKIRGFPRPIMRACLTADSAMFPKTKARTIGAMG
jgi:hypothetical protein